MNFKILAVNSQDLSGATHETASEALQNASEPITVVLSRSTRINETKNVHQTTTYSTTAENNPRNSSLFTQTRSHNCFCSFLLQNIEDVSSPLYSELMREWLRYRESNPQSDFCTSNIAEQNLDNYQDEIDHAYYSVDFEEILLNRPSSDEKLGITLRDHLDDFTNQIKVVVTDVAPDSIASKCQKIQEGDHILKIDGELVNCMNDASRLLHKNTQTISFLIGHPVIVQEHTWLDEDKRRLDNNLQYGHASSAVTKCEILQTSERTSEGPRSRFVEQHRPYNDCVDYNGVTPPKLLSDTNRTTESVSSTTSIASESQTAKDSGIGHTLESNIQTASENCTQRSTSSVPHLCERKSIGRSINSPLAERFPIESPNEVIDKVSPLLQNKSAGNDAFDSAKGSMDRSFYSKSNTDLEAINNAIHRITLIDDKQKTKSPSTLSGEAREDKDKKLMSPWVKIARQDYEDKLLQLEQGDDVRNIHPALEADNVADLATVARSLPSSRSSSDAAENTSSAYSTGESFRSSSTSSVPQLRDENLSDYRVGATMTCYMSSDANSDGEGPACYLTHAEESGSEGFEDAALEFCTAFHSAPYKPIPLPRLLHPPCKGKNLMLRSLNTPTQQLCKTTAAAETDIRNRHETIADKEQPMSAVFSSFGSQKSVAFQRKCSRSTNASSNDKSESETIVAENSKKSCEEITCTNNVSYLPKHSGILNNIPEAEPTHCANKLSGTHVRRSSNHVRFSKKQQKTKRIFSHVESPYSENYRKSEDTDGTNVDASMEWKVRVSKDGTRYITKRPVREQILRHREKRLLAERCGITTDDDATELKLGRHWSRDDRKRHLRIAREKKRRRDFMQRCRLEVLNENPPADGEIVELSHKKMTKQKHKRMLLDNFVTVQEILAHGDRTSDVTKLNPLLSVTYI